MAAPGGSGRPIVQLRADMALSELVAQQKALLARRLQIVDRLTELEVRRGAALGGWGVGAGHRG